MSGIFKGDSIYRSGGGGGGYKDGGALVDDDFIKVENNTISSYDNTARSDINYYFEVADGEILNAVIEVTNDVNATVHVYIYKNGFYIPLGNIGGDTVTAGNDYKLNIIGDSFTIEEVYGGNASPEYVNLDGTIYVLTKIGGLIWTTKNLELDVSYLGNYRCVKKGGQWWYATASYNDIVTEINNKYLSYGFRVPFYEDVQNLIASISNNSYDIRSLTGWEDNQNGNGNTKFNAIPYGECNGSDQYASIVNQGKNATFAINKNPPPGHQANHNSFYIRYNVGGIGISDGTTYYTFNIRLCKDA